MPELLQNLCMEPVKQCSNPIWYVKDLNISLNAYHNSILFLEFFAFDFTKHDILMVYGPSFNFIHKSRIWMHLTPWVFLLCFYVMYSQYLCFISVFMIHWSVYFLWNSFSFANYIWDSIEPASIKVNHPLQKLLIRSILHHFLLMQNGPVWCEEICSPSMHMHDKSNYYGSTVI